MIKEPMIYVRWVDSALQSDWVEAPSNKTGTMEVESIGYLIYEDRKHIEIAQSMTPIHRNAIMSIPRSVILERKELKVKNA